MLFYASGFKLNKERFFLLLILFLSFCLNIFGIRWGLPSCWNTDQSVTVALNMLKNKTFIPQDYLHPALYYYVLICFLAPYVLFQYVFYPGFDTFLSAARVSWNYMAINHPEMASGIFINARSLSVLFSLLTVILVYKTTKIIHSGQAGLFSALILTITMDFVNWAHIEKSVALVNLLILLTAYYVILILKNGYALRKYFLGCLFGGLALSVKFNGALTFLIIPVISAYRGFEKQLPGYFKINFLKFIKTFCSGSVIYILAFVLTSPSILLSLNKYYTRSTSEYGNKLLPASLLELSKICLSNILYMTETLIQMFGLPLALLSACGLGYVMFKYCRRIPAFFVVVYFPIITVCLLSLSPRIYLWANSKFLAQITPFLAILGGVFTADLLRGTIFCNVKIFLKIIVLFIIFISSLVYCLSLDNIFAHNDLRYRASEWVKINIPFKSNIILLNQLEYSLDVKILNDFNVYVLGDSPGTKGAYSFVNRCYYNIDNDALKKVKDLNQSYAIRSCWQLKHNLTCASLGILSGENKLIRTFERKAPWYWNPSMGGYEPSRIEIYKLIKK